MYIYCRRSCNSHGILHSVDFRTGRSSHSEAYVGLTKCRVSCEDEIRELHGDGDSGNTAVTVVNRGNEDKRCGNTAGWGQPARYYGGDGNNK